MSTGYFVHASAYVDQPCDIGVGTKIWHFCHLTSGCRLGRNCNLGQNVFIGAGVVLGDNVKVQNNVSIYAGTVVENDVFLGPSCVLTNVSNPRAQINRHALYETTLLRRGCTVGANATIVCGVTVGRYAFVAAGAVVTRNTPDYAFMVGVPARQSGWMSRHGHRLGRPDAEDLFVCPESGLRYRQHSEPSGATSLRCIDLHEDAPLPPELSQGERGYGSYKQGKG